MIPSIRNGALGVLMSAMLLASAWLPVARAAVPPPYELDAANRIITVRPGGDVTANVNKALDYLMRRTDKQNKWTLKFMGGRYVMTRHLYADNLQNTDLVSDRNNPAIIIKGPGYQNEYLFYSRFAKNVSISGFQFYGLTDFRTSNNPVWSDQGVYFGSSNSVTIDRNRFHNFGNAALRITTSESDPVRGINSFNSTVTNNYFHNVFQITTTSNDLIHGATSHYLFKNNNIVNLKGSLKFASRTPGMSNIKVIGNSIIGSATDGIEVDSFSNVEFSSNRIENIARYAVNCYTNDRANPGFNWGDNVIFRSNQIRGAMFGIRISPSRYPDGFQPVPHSMVLDANTIEDIRGTMPAIYVVNGYVDGLSITRNKLARITSKKYFQVSKESQRVVISGNLVDNAPYLASN